jgi:hypothetical protein
MTMNMCRICNGVRVNPDAGSVLSGLDFSKPLGKDRVVRDGRVVSVYEQQSDIFSPRTARHTHAPPAIPKICLLFSNPDNHDNHDKARKLWVSSASGFPFLP